MNKVTYAIIFLLIGAVIGFSIAFMIPSSETIGNSTQVVSDNPQGIVPLDELASQCAADSRGLSYPGAGAITHKDGLECYEFVQRLLYEGTSDSCAPFEGKDKAICVGTSLKEPYYENYCDDSEGFRDICLLNMANRMIYTTKNSLDSISDFCSEIENTTYMNFCKDLVRFRKGEVNSTYLDEEYYSVYKERWSYFNSPGYSF